MEQSNLQNEEFIKIISDGTFDEVIQAISKMGDINKPIGYQKDDIRGCNVPVYILDIALLNSKDINVINFLLERGALYTTPLPYVISHCKTTGIFTLLLGYPNVKNGLLKILVKIILNFIPIPLIFVTSAMKNPNPEILKEVVTNERVFKILKNEKRKGIDLKTYFKSISTENTEEKYKIFEELNKNL